MEQQSINLKSRYSSAIPRRGYLTHGFDSYPAKMIPQMARFLVEEVSEPGQTILDPFCGSGAVLVESLVSGRNAIGVDLNPLAVLFAKAKTTIYSSSVLEVQLGELSDWFKYQSTSYQYDFPNASYWFTPATLRKFGIIKTVLASYLPNIDPSYAFFWKGVLAAIVRECSRADTRGPKPFISKKAREKRLGRHFDPIRMFKLRASSWISAERRYASKFEENPNRPRIRLIEGDARNLCQLLHGETVDAVVTSPPYLTAQDYYRASKLQLYILGDVSAPDLREHTREFVGSDRILDGYELLDVTLPFSMANAIKSELVKHRRRNACIFTKYVLDMSKVLNEMGHLLKKDAYCVIVSGYNLISDIIIPTPQVILGLAEIEGFELVVCYSDKIRDRWVPTIRNGHKGVINEEYLLILRKTI
jgi:DNA modification methylase